MTQVFLGPPELEPLVSICDMLGHTLLTARPDPLGSLVRGASLLNPSSLLGGLAGMALPRRVEASLDARRVTLGSFPKVLQS